MTEKQIETQILAWLNYQKQTFAFKINTVGIFDPVKKVFRKNHNRFLMKGTSDILGVCQGRFFAIEVKTPSTIKRFTQHPTLSDLRQQTFLSQVMGSGGAGICVSSLDEVIEWFRQYSS